MGDREEMLTGNFRKNGHSSKEFLVSIVTTDGDLHVVSSMTEELDGN